ncbi:hypothetical protein GCM10023075_53480 [Streptosporangium album]
MAIAHTTTARIAARPVSCGRFAMHLSPSALRHAAHAGLPHHGRHGTGSASPRRGPDGSFTIRLAPGQIGRKP